MDQAVTEGTGTPAANVSGTHDHEMNEPSSGQVTPVEPSTGRQQPLAAMRHTPGTGAEGVLVRVRDAFAAPTPPEVAASVDEAYARAEQIVSAAGRGAAAHQAAALTYASEAIIALAAEGELASEDVHAAAAILADALGIELQATRFLIFSRTVANPRLVELPHSSRPASSCGCCSTSDSSKASRSGVAPSPASRNAFSTSAGPSPEGALGPRHGRCCVVAPAST